MNTFSFQAILGRTIFDSLIIYIGFNEKITYATPWENMFVFKGPYMRRSNRSLSMILPIWKSNFYLLHFSEVL